jgi:MoxR-like ATPase
MEIVESETSKSFLSKINDYGVRELRQLARHLRNNGGLAKPVSSLDIAKMNQDGLKDLLLKYGVADKAAGFEPRQDGEEPAPAPKPEPGEEPGKPEEPEAPAPAKPEAAPKPGADDSLINIQKLIEVISTGVKKDLKGDMAALAKAVQEQMRPREIEIKIPNLEPKIIKNQHFMFEELVKHVVSKESVLMSGPAGSGKSYAGNKLAEVLGRIFRYVAVCATTTKSDLAGYVDMHGNFRDVSGLKMCVKDGGLFMVDEIDGGNPNILIIINDLTAKTPGRDTWQAPDGEIVKIHENFAFIACANTWGLGADEQYVGRNRLDASTRDRFNKLSWDYDERLEAEIVGHKDTTDYVKKVRKAVFKLKEHVVVSPRSAQKIAKMIQCGIVKSPAEGADRTIWPGVSIDVKQRVLAEVK